ncbi:hypothetical protein ACFYPT_41820 [Streptomyces sp. NPDC005529]|uniref:hypothetical protein n=1 Tax=unclassified Streptomyces TaxID=2593676 RepID=UPI0033B83947
MAAHGPLHPPTRFYSVALSPRLHPDRLQQKLLRRHQPLPPDPLRHDPHAQILALHDQLATHDRG